MKIIKYFTTVFLAGLSSLVSAQTLTQTIRGVVIDQISQSPLIGANVIVLNSNPLLGGATDVNGVFVIPKVSVGMQNLRITFMGYKELILPNVNVTSGKEVVLNITLEENVVMGKEVVITDEVRKDRPLNEFTTVSGRTFSVEETQKYAAAVNDPARMSTAFAGVVATDDGNNNISIRGNSPAGLLWRMEGVEIPNPNHFSSEGTSGGGISILSAQLLTNSDFLTGAFAPEYGNAISGVFDMKLRKGNNRRTERTLQAGFLGTDLAIEGPFKTNYDGSYLVNYRYSTLSLLNKLGVSVGDATTNFQDLSYNVFLPTRASGTFSFWGFVGLSNQVSTAKKDSSKWETDFDRYSWEFKSNTGASGVSHFVQLDKNTFLKNTFSIAVTAKEQSQLKLDHEYNEVSQGFQRYDQNKYSLNSILTKKIDSRNSVKAGIIVSAIFYDFRFSYMNETKTAVETRIDQNGTAYTLQSFAQWNFHATEKLTFNSGVHFLYFPLNKSHSIEPRISAKYEPDDRQSFSIGYGLHGQIQPMGVYFAQKLDDHGSVTQPNRNIGLTKAHHLVVGYDRSFTSYFHVKLEAYYQSLFNVPVSTSHEGTFSILNNEYDFVTESLTGTGKGENKGLELTVEQYLHNDFYFLLSSSIYDSKYKASNGNWYNTRFNGNYSFSLTGGKEFKTGEKFGKRIVGINVKSIYSGGLRNTPIDYAASLAAGDTKYVESKAFSLRAKEYFRTDVKFSVKRNRKKSTITWSLDFQNITNQKNEFGEYFDPLTAKTKTSYQAPLIPVLAYKIDF